MELVFITRAIRRYWWTVVLGVLLGVVGAYLGMRADTDVYESHALLLVSPVTEWGASATSTDRFVQNQVSLLSSSTLAEQVAEEVGVDAATVVRSTTFEQILGTDVIRVGVQHRSPTVATDIANRYVDSYLESMRTQAVEARAPDLEEIDDRLESLERQIAVVDAEIRLVMQPYLPGGEIGGADPQIVPTINEIEPALATRRDVAIKQYSDLLAQRNSMEVGGAQARSGTQVWQRADSALSTSTRERPLVLFAGPLVGMMLGCLAAVGLARSSDRVLDADEVSEVLGTAVAGRAVLRTTDAASVLATRVPVELADITHHLCVRAEAGGASNRALVVVVTGSEDTAGTAVVAAAMSRRFASSGARVAMVAANGASAQMSEALGEGLNNVERLIQVDQSPALASRSGEPLSMVEVGDPTVAFAGSGTGSTGFVLRHQDVASLINAAAQRVDVVVFDAGELMRSAASVRLAQFADVVVLTVPLKRQRRDALKDVAREVGGLSTVLPVLTRVGRRRHSSGPVFQSTHPDDVSQARRDDPPVVEVARSGARVDGS